MSESGPKSGAGLAGCVGHWSAISHSPAGWIRSHSRFGSVVSHLVTLLSPEWARYPLPQHCSLSPTRVLAGTRQEHSYTRVSRRRGTPPPARPMKAPRNSSAALVKFDEVDGHITKYVVDYDRLFVPVFPVAREPRPRGRPSPLLPPLRLPPDSISSPTSCSGVRPDAERLAGSWLSTA